MKKNKKKLGCFIIVLVVLALLAFTIAFFVFGIPNSGDGEKTERNWIKKLTNIEVPQNTQMLYRKEPPKGIFPVPGRELGYSVYQFESEPTDWLQENGFSSDPNEKFASSFQDYIPAFLDETISSDYIPDFNKPYYWIMTENAVYFVYQPDKLMLMVFIHPY